MDQILLTPTEARLLLSGKYIQTIKSVQERGGGGLYESKAFVDRALNEMGYMTQVTCLGCRGLGYTAQRSAEYEAIRIRA